MLPAIRRRVNPKTGKNTGFFHLGFIAALVVMDEMARRMDIHNNHNAQNPKPATNAGRAQLRPVATLQCKSDTVTCLEAWQWNALGSMTPVQLEPTPTLFYNGVVQALRGQIRHNCWAGLGNHRLAGCVQ
jgi:hypothetical protein